MSLRGKVVLFLAMALVDLSLVYLGNYYFHTQTADAQALGVGAMEALELIQSARVAERASLQEGKPELAKQVGHHLDRSLRKIDELTKLVGGGDIRAQIKSLAKEAVEYRQTFAQVKENVLQVFKLREEMLALGQRLSEINRVRIEDRITQLEAEKLYEGENLPAAFLNFKAEAKDLAAQMDRLTLSSQRLFLSNNENNYLAQLEIIKGYSQRHLGNAKQLLPSLNDKDLAVAFGEILKNIAPLQDAGDKLHALWKAGPVLIARLDKVSGVLATGGKSVQEYSRLAMESSARLANILGLAVTVLASVLLLGWGLYLVRSTFGPLRRAVGALEDVVGKVEASSDLARASSQSLAEGSAEQAASLEQIAQAVNQMDAVTQRTAGEANQSAEAAQGMGAQAEVLKEVTGDLVKVLEGGRAGADMPALESRQEVKLLAGN